MIATQFLFTLFCTVFFCLGYRVVTSEGNLLYFLRKPFEDIENKVEVLKDRLSALSKFNTEKEFISDIEADININVFLLHLAKPLITCITCTASVWGAAMFITMNGLNDITYLIINCFCASFIQTFIWKIYVKLD